VKGRPAVPLPFIVGVPHGQKSQNGSSTGQYSDNEVQERLM
jgi:hypothetical protein